MQDLEKDVCSIENSIDLNEKYLSVVDRYYLRKFCVEVAEPGDDYSVLIHSNGVCLLSLAPTHSIVSSRLSIESISFQVSEGLNRLDNKVTGKLKHGAQKVKPTSPLLVVTLADGSSKVARCAISGKLLEVNRRLVEEPDLMVSAPNDVGYMAIILPDLCIQQLYRNSLLSKEQYEERVSKKKTSILSDTEKPVS